MDVATLTDTELDTALEQEFHDRRAAMDAGNQVEAQACQIAARAILAELSRRIDEWIAGRV